MNIPICGEFGLMMWGSPAERMTGEGAGPTSTHFFEDEGVGPAPSPVSF